MGNWLTLEALQAFRRDGKESGASSLRGQIGALILASPDVDADLFKEELPMAMAAADRVALFVSQKDALLQISSALAHGAPRAGNASPEELQNRRIFDNRNFTIVPMDGPEIGECFDGSHRCAETNARVLKQIRALLRTQYRSARWRSASKT